MHYQIYINKNKELEKSSNNLFEKIPSDIFMSLIVYFIENCTIHLIIFNQIGFWLKK